MDVNFLNLVYSTVNTNVLYCKAGNNYEQTDFTHIYMINCIAIIMFNISFMITDICYVMLPCTYIAPKSDISFRGALQRITVYWVAEGDRYDCQLII